MSLTVDIVKRQGRRGSEAFIQEKLHASIVAACLSVRTPIGQAESIARKVTEDVMDWLEDRPEVTSHDIRRVATRHLHTHHPDAAYLYQQYKITM